MDNTTVIRPFKKANYAVISINCILLSINISFEKQIWDYFILANLVLVTIWFAYRFCNQRIIFSQDKVTFIKMVEAPGKQLPTSLKLNYQDIDSVRLVGDHLFINSPKGKVNFPLKPRSTLANRLKQAFEVKGIQFEVNSCIA